MMITVAIILLSFAVPEPAGADAYLEAWTLERAAKYGDAVGKFHALAEAESPLAPYARAHEALCRYRAGDSEGAVKSLRSLLDQSAEGSWRRYVSYELGSILKAHGANEEAAPLLAQAGASPLNLWWLRNIRWQAAEASLELPDVDQHNYAFFRVLVEISGLIKERLDAAQILARSPKVEDRLAAAEGMVKSNEYGDARKLLLALAADASADPLNHAFWKQVSGRALIGLGEYSQGQTLLQETYTSDASGKHGPVALLYAVRGRVREKRFDDAVALTAIMAARFPDAPEHGDALWYLGRGLRDSGDTAGAVRAFTAIAEMFPEHQRADEGLLEASALLQGEDALVPLRELCGLKSAYAPTQTEGCFRLAERLQNAGDHEGAVEHWKHAATRGFGVYQGHLAAAQLGAPAYEPVDIGSATKLLCTAVRKPFQDSVPPREVMEDPNVQRAAFFAKHGMIEGEWEALGVFETMPEGKAALPYLQALSEAGVAHSIWDFLNARGWDTVGDPTDATMLRLRYPRAYWEAFQKQAAEAQVDPYLLLAIARQESTFRPAIQSWAGATGVMQLMPDTANWLAKVDVNIKTDHADFLSYPDYSIRLGAFYMQRMLERDGGAVVYALASYNAGPGNCSKWKRRWPEVSLSEFIELIPFSETNSYVKKVLGNYAAYKSLYGGAPAG